MRNVFESYYGDLYIHSYEIHTALEYEPRDRDGDTPTTTRPMRSATFLRNSSIPNSRPTLKVKFIKEKGRNPSSGRDGEEGGRGAAERRRIA